MKSFARFFCILSLTALCVACGGGGSSAAAPPAPPEQSANANLGTLTLAGADLSSIQLDQIFQPTQTDYTAGVVFLVASVHLNASSEDPNAVVRVNGTPIDTAGIDVSLAEGSNTIQIEVTAEDGVTTALYTLTITRETIAQFSHSAYIKASNTDASDNFGLSVAFSGDTLAVGARFEASATTGIDGDQNDNSLFRAGASYVFTRDGAGVWSQQAYIKPSTIDVGDYFGQSIALSGATLAVGALFEDSAATGIDGDQSDNNATSSGAVYVFTRDGAGIWSQQAYVKASNTDAFDRFSWSVALSGDTLAVSAYLERSAATGINGDQNDNSATFAGAVYVFTRDGAGVWSQQAYVKASNTDAGDEFGQSVALSGDTLAVGAIGEESAATGINGDQSDNSATTAGAVYVFTRDGAGVWSQQAYLKASNTEADDFFGNSVALSGDTLAVGALVEDSAATGIDGDQSNNNAGSSGAVYVFTRHGAGIWSQQAYIKASNTDAVDHFGDTVALSADGNTLAVGVPDEDSNATGINGDQSDNSAVFAGAVYVFTRDGAGVWTQQAYIKASNTDAGDAFGNSVALSGDTLAVSAPLEDSTATGIDGDQSDNNASFSGAVYVLE